MIRTSYALSLVIFLSACGTNPDGSTIVGVPGSPFWRNTASPEVIAEYYGERCEKFGFKSGTDAMAFCIQEEISQDRRRQSASAERLQADISKAFEPSNSNYRPTRCSQYRSTANYSTINCY